MSKLASKTTKTFAAAALSAAALASVFAHAGALAERKMSASASTLSQYRVRVRSAAEALEDFAAFCEKLSRGEKPDAGSRDGSAPDIAEEFPARQRAALERARTLLPPKERVEWGGDDLEADNSWLNAALDDYAKLGDNEKRADSLRSVSQRLRALESRLAEVEEGAHAAAQDRDAERGRLNAILRGPDFNKPPQGNALQGLAEDFREWLARHWPRFGGGGAPSPRLSMLAQFIVIALCVVVLAYVARRVWANRTREVKSLKLKRRPRVILGERLEADDTPADLLEAAEGLARAGDMRGAIRKAYVALLCGLGDVGVIRLAQGRTNSDYLDAVRRSARGRLYEDMLPLTRGFEQHWYGLRDATAADWADYHARCRQTLKQF